MDRLTFRLGDTNPSYGLVDKASAKPGLFTEYDGFFAHLLATHRLGQYEDTGLTPEEITANMEMFAAYRHVCDGITPDEMERILNAYGRCQTLRTETAERLRLIKTIPTERLEEAVNLYKDNQDGLLLRLPCQRGDTVWRICGQKGKKYVAERVVQSVAVHGPGQYQVFTNCHDWLGKTVFLSRAESEVALNSNNQPQEKDT